MIHPLPSAPTSPTRATRVVLLAACAVVAVGAGALVGAPVPATVFWLGALWVSWGAVSLFVVAQRDPSFAFVGLQAGLLIFVVIPATMATQDGAVIAGYDFSDGTTAALRMAVLAQVGFAAGLVAVRSTMTSRRPVRLPLDLPAKPLDNLALVMLALSLLSLVVYSVIAGADLTKFNVLAEQNDYGDFQTTATGSQIKYFLVLQGLAGASLVLATVRLTCCRGRSRVLPVLVMVAVFVMLGMGGQRTRLIVPLVAAGLVWWKTSQGRLSVRPRTVLAVGGALLLVLISWMGYVRVNPDERNFDPLAAVTEQFQRADLFSLSAGLVENIPKRRDYLYGDSYLEVVALPVPRAVWEDKPEGSVKEVVGTFMELGSGVSFPTYGEMYYNFGLVGVALGTVLFGALLEYVYLRFVRAANLGSMLLWVSCVPIMLQASIRGYLVGQVAGSLGIVLGLAIAAWYLRRRVPEHQLGLDPVSSRGDAGDAVPALSARAR